MNKRQEAASVRAQRREQSALHSSRPGERGQTLVTVALLMTIVLGMLGLAIDVGYAYSERRQIQDAADAAALNGARTLDAQITTGNQIGADTQVLLAIKQYITAYNLTVNASGNALASLLSAVYVSATGGASYGTVGEQASQQIPAGAAGVRVVVQESWTSFVFSLLSGRNFTIAATAAAIAGVLPGGKTVFVNCPPYSGGQATENLSFSGSGTGSPDIINGSVFVNGSVGASGGLVHVTGTFGASGTVQGTIQADGGISQNQPPQQFPLPDVAFPLTTGGAPNTAIENTGTAAYTPPGASPEFDQEAYWDFYLGYNTDSLPGQGNPGQPPHPGVNGPIDMYFEVNLTPNASNQIALNRVLAQIPDVTQANYFPAYQGHYTNFFSQWVSQVYAASPSPATDFPWLHWVDIAGSSNPTSPATWYTLTPTLLSGRLVFQAQPSQHPVNAFGGICPTATCLPSGIWWALNWSATSQIDMSDLDVAWTNPSGGQVVLNAGITFLTNVEFYYQGSSAANLFGWGYAAATHPAENISYSGWGAAGTLYVPRTVLYTTFAPPLPGDCTSTPPVEALHANGSSQEISGFVLIPYGSITFNGAGASNFSGAIFAAQLSFNGSGVMLTYDARATTPTAPILLE
jgi:Flp pilus assembly protein TadG